MAIDVGVVHGSPIPIELEAIGQLVLRGKGLGIQIVNSIVEQVGGGRLLEAVPHSRRMSFGQIDAVAVTDQGKERWDIYRGVIL